MKATKWNENWMFWEDKDSFALVWNVPETARKVTLPHDAMLERRAYAESPNMGNTGFRDGGIYCYVKNLHVPKDACGKLLMLKFEGVYMNAMVYVNSQLAGKNMFGYSTFYVPLNDLIKYGEDNEIRVQVRNSGMTNSRWYSGSGIYRDVYLLESEQTYLVPEGVRVTTESVDDGASGSVNAGVNSSVNGSENDCVNSSVNGGENDCANGSVNGSANAGAKGSANGSVDDSCAVIKVTSELKNLRPAPADLMLETVIRDGAGVEVAREHAAVMLFGQEERTLSQRIAVASPQLWSDENPALYTYEIVLFENSSARRNAAKSDDSAANSGEAGDSGNGTSAADTRVVLDSESGTFGIRTLQVDAKHGLRVNGRSVKLRGACVHHDSGLLGAATFEEFHLRQAKILKEAGFNAVRSSHQPMAPAMLKACDEVGIYVMDEFSDMWNRAKSDLDYALYFQEWWEKDVTAMVRRDYNHPCVVLYSIGNEIPEIGSDAGAKICYEMNKKFKELDSTRYTTAGINGVFAAGDRIGEIMADLAKGSAEAGAAEGTAVQDGINAQSEAGANAQSETGAQAGTDTQNGGEDAPAAGGNVNDFMTMMDTRMNDIVVHRAISDKLEKACAYLDVAGYNYMTARYERDAKDYPNRVIVGSETYPPDIARNWGIIKKASHVIGDFTWTGWDYIGEAGVGIPAYHWGEGGFGAEFPAQLAYCGDIDITGRRRPASYYRECVFGLREEPYIAVQNPRHYGEPLIKTPWVISDATPSWTWEGCEGKPVIIEVYAPGDEVELFVNGKSVGRKPSGEAAGYRTLFETTYEPGTVTAVVYKKDGTGTKAGVQADSNAIEKTAVAGGNETDAARTDAAKADAVAAAQTELYTAAAPAQVALTCEEIAKDELLFIDVQLLDAAGTLAIGAESRLKAEVSGGAVLAGFGSGNPKPDYNYLDGVADTWGATALLILRKTGTGDAIQVKVSTEDGLLTGELEIEG
ncbi:MAG: DUF4982 domain-containing protein [Lachnospiraceae bacterium]|nr:DUF4982 domain-containing protein [Lachnospiraceae bacterium]